MAYATAEDVVELWAREPEPEVKALIERRLAQVERMIIRRIPDLAARIEDSHLDVADVIDIEAEAVLRVIRNPEGLQAENDGNYGYQLSRAAADNRLRLLADEWERLGVRQRKIFQIEPRTGRR
ncbi:hypothetical protein FHR72_003637 [Mycolicibacterium iranicum]|uniref:Head-to-tail adaptor n=1 Tax=Mycolicibacterium iranicum TaxID=912594 RepID=A0A839QIK9_MYCIR|nr:Gp19/Gp15/Gp42 family protein [Mycolicibacterium iranicum]MBB2992141.1 hypothetical protein [Mycolicibacterium iranicum]